MIPDYMVERAARALAHQLRLRSDASATMATSNSHWDEPPVPHSLAENWRELLRDEARAVLTAALGDPDTREWVVFYGGPDPDNCAGIRSWWGDDDGEANAYEEAEWTKQAGVASRPVWHGEWTIAPAEMEQSVEVTND